MMKEKNNFRKSDLLIIHSEAIANMDDDFILLQIYDETQDEVRDKDLEVRKIEAKVILLNLNILIHWVI